MLLESYINDIVENPITHSPIILLKEKDGNRVLSIDIGLFEANTIANQKDGIESPRPMTHDLIYSIMNTAEIKLKSVIIDKELNKTFYASLNLINSSLKEVIIDSRPSDAITLALKYKAPILIHETLFNKCQNECTKRLNILSPFFL